MHVRCLEPDPPWRSNVCDPVRMLCRAGLDKYKHLASKQVLRSSSRRYAGLGGHVPDAAAAVGSRGSLDKTRLEALFKVAEDPDEDEEDLDDVKATVVIEKVKSKLQRVCKRCNKVILRPTCPSRRRRKGINSHTRSHRASMTAAPPKTTARPPIWPPTSTSLCRPTAGTDGRSCSVRSSRCSGASASSSHTGCCSQKY